MKTTPMIIIALAIASTPAQAIDKCTMPDGSVMFSDLGCPTDSKTAAEYTLKDNLSTGGSGLRPGEKYMLEGIKADEEYDRAARTYSRQKSSRHYINYGDRNKLRTLERKRDRLSKNLSSRSYSDAIIRREQIRGINRQIDQIKRPKW